MTPLVHRAKTNDQEARGQLSKILADYKSTDKFVDAVLFHEVKDLKLSSPWLTQQQTDLANTLGFIESLRG